MQNNVKPSRFNSLVCSVPFVKRFYKTSSPLFQLINIFYGMEPLIYILDHPYGNNDFNSVFIKIIAHVVEHHVEQNI